MRQAHALPTAPHQSRSLAHHVLGLARRAWTAYWTRKAEQATLVILRSLDDRTLKDIGMDRSEIESVVRTASCSRSAERRIAMCI
jgi:uncharacterized protein YjiS (DUF1127 family)